MAHQKMAEHQELQTCIIDKFVTIQEKSKEMRDNYKDLKTTHQIVCIMVMSEEEVRNKTFPANPDIKDFVNQKVTHLSDLGKIIQNLHRKKEVHGEIIALRLKDYMPNLKEKYLGTLASTDKSSKPYVFIYSHFLPCAGLLDHPYACAEELAKQALLTRDNFNVLVGYSEVFGRTHKELALGYLHHDSLYALVNVRKGKCELRSEDSFFTPQVDVFQKKFYECILQDIETTSCQNCRASENTKTIIRNEIDALIQRCIGKQTSEPRGPLTYLDMKMLQTCFKDEKWFNVCSHDSMISQSELVDKCYTRVMEDAYNDSKTILVLGQPSDTEPFWMENENLCIEWAKLYPNNNEHESQPNERKRSRSPSRPGENIKRQKSN